MTVPIVLIHGGNCAGACWADVLAELTGPAIAVDLPGRGRHPADLAKVTLDDWADSVIADMDKAGFERAVCVGHSLGGATLTTLARRYPERLAGVAFVACPVPDTGGNVAAACAPEIEALFQARQHDGIVVMDKPDPGFAAQIFGNDMDAAMTQRMCDDLAKESLPVFLEKINLSGLRNVPVLYVKLTLDAASPPAVQDQAIAYIRPNKVMEIASGHMAMYTQPAALAATIEDWASNDL